MSTAAHNGNQPEIRFCICVRRSGSRAEVGKMRGQAARTKGETSIRTVRAGGGSVGSALVTIGSAALVVLIVVSTVSVSDAWASNTAGHRTAANGATAQAAGLTWQINSTYPSLLSINDITCPSPADCYAVGGDNAAHGVILVTTNSGTTWSAQTIPGATSLNGLACPSTTDCFAVGHGITGGVIVNSTNAGGSWSGQTVPPRCPFCRASPARLSPSARR